MKNELPIQHNSPLSLKTPFNALQKTAIQPQDSDGIPIIRSARLCLRELRSTDTDSYWNLMSNPESIKYYRQPLSSIEEVNAEFEKDKRRFKVGEAIRWAVTINEKDAFIGNIDIYNIQSYKHKATLGCALLPEYRHKGIAFEAINAVLSFLFNSLNFNRIELYVHPENTQAIKTYKSIGFQQEGILREYEIFENSFTDMILFSILKNEWKTKI